MVAAVSAGLELRPDDVGVIARVYYSVKTGSSYGYGDEFPGTVEGHAAACRSARDQIKRFDYGPGRESFSRVWVETRHVIRWRDGAECGAAAGAELDRPVDSIEIKLSEDDKDARWPERRDAA